MKKLLTLIIVLSLTLFTVACKNQDTNETPADDTYKAEDITIEENQELSENETPAENPVNNMDFDYEVQISEPEKGEEIAVMHTNHGDIFIKFFEEEAPKAVENFKTHAKDGYYDDVIFHRVINNFMIQGGDPTGTGAGGESIWGEPFEDEFVPNRLNFRGALSMANSGPGTNGSQFFIVQAPEVPSEWLEALEKGGYPKEAVEIYGELGGTPWLDFNHTVFGQVFKGMEVVDEIAAVKVGEDDKPVEDVVIEGIEIKVY